MKKQTETHKKVNLMANLETVRNIAAVDESILASLDDLLPVNATDDHDEILESLEAEMLETAEEAVIEEVAEPADVIIDDIVETVEEPEVEAAAVVEDNAMIIDDLALEDLDMEIAKQEAYIEQQANAPALVISDEADLEPTKSADKPKRTRSASSTPARKRVLRDLSTLDTSMFVLEGDASALSEDDKSALRDAFMSKMPGQKKVREKIEMVMCGLAAGQTPNRYVEIPFKLLATKGKVTRSDIMAAYLGSERKDGSTNLNSGTAHAQTGQLMVLLPYLGIAKVSGKNELEWNDQSIVGAKLKELFGL